MLYLSMVIFHRKLGCPHEKSPGSLIKARCSASKSYPPWELEIDSQISAQRAIKQATHEYTLTSPLVFGRGFENWIWFVGSTLNNTQVLHIWICLARFNPKHHPTVEKYMMKYIYILIWNIGWNMRIPHWSKRFSDLFADTEKNHQGGCCLSAKA